MSVNNNKDTYWFSHDSNAKDDPKCMMLIDQLGLEGYGIYWVLVEILRDQPDFSYPLALIPAIAKRYGTSEQKVETVVRNFGLFYIRDERFFYSDSLIRRILAYKEKVDKRKAAALKGAVAKWEKERARRGVDMLTQCEGSAVAMLTQCEGDANLCLKDKIIKDKIIDNSSSLHSELSPTPGESEPQETPADPRILSRKNCQQVVDFWNGTLDSIGSTLPRVRSLPDSRVDKIRVRWREFSGMGDPVEVCRTLFRKAAASSFLQGGNSNGWKASFDWLMTNGKNWVKVYEGNYDDTAPGRTGRADRVWESARRNLETPPFNPDGTVNI